MAKSPVLQPADPKTARELTKAEPPVTALPTPVSPGGELHQQAESIETQLTTNQGVPISDNQNSLKAGPRGPVLLQDFILREKITAL